MRETTRPRERVVSFTVMPIKYLPPRHPARPAPHASFQPPLSFSAVRDLLVAVGVLAPNASTGRSACVRVRLRARAHDHRTARP